MRKVNIAGIIVLFVAVCSLALLVPMCLPATAASDIQINRSKVDNLPTDNANDLVPKILGAVYILSGTIAIITIIAAGIMYITSDGDSTKTATARKAIIYSVVGLVFIGLAFIITGIVQNIANS